MRLSAVLTALTGCFQRHRQGVHEHDPDHHLNPVPNPSASHSMPGDTGHGSGQQSASTRDLQNEPPSNSLLPNAISNQSSNDVLQASPPQHVLSRTISGEWLPESGPYMTGALSPDRNQNSQQTATGDDTIPPSRLGPRPPAPAPAPAWGSRIPQANPSESSSQRQHILRNRRGQPEQRSGQDPRVRPVAGTTQVDTSASAQHMGNTPDGAATQRGGRRLSPIESDDGEPTDDPLIQRARQGLLGLGPSLRRRNGEGEGRPKDRSPPEKAQFEDSEKK